MKINYLSSLAIKCFWSQSFLSGSEGPCQSRHTAPQERAARLSFIAPPPVLLVHEWNGMVGQCTLIWRNAWITQQTRWGSWSRLSNPGCCMLSSSCDQAVVLQYSWCLWKMNDATVSVLKTIWNFFFFTWGGHSNACGAANPSYQCTYCKNNLNLATWERRKFFKKNKQTLTVFQILIHQNMKDTKKCKGRVGYFCTHRLDDECFKFTADSDLSVTVENAVP